MLTCRTIPRYLRPTIRAGPLKRDPSHVLGLKMLSAAAIAASTSSGSFGTPKPPNVLIYQHDKDTTSKEFLRVKESLVSALTPERYVIYPLGADDILQYSPWKDNCRILVVPPPTATEHAHKPSRSVSTATLLSPKVVEEMLLYAQTGGCLLSMRPSLNEVLGFTPIRREALDRAGAAKSVLLGYCQDGVCDVEVTTSTAGGMKQKYRFSCLVPDCDRTRSESDDAYLSSLSLQKWIVSSSDEAFLVPLEWNADTQWLEQNTNQSNRHHQSVPTSTRQESHDISQIFPCVRKLVLRSGGCAVLANVDLLAIPPPGIELAPLVRLKKNVVSRGQYFTSLLRGFGLGCSEEKFVTLTHTYLLCSDQVYNYCAAHVQFESVELLKYKSLTLLSFQEVQL